MNLARTLWPSEAPLEEGRVETFPPARPAPYTEELEARIAHPLGAIAGELHAIREALAPGPKRRFTIPNGGVIDAGGNGNVLYDGPRPGETWLIEMLFVSVGGASGGAAVEVYANAVDEANIIASLAGLNGANPSRGFIDVPGPGVVFGGQPVIVRVLGAAVNQQITTRIQGEREIEGG